MKCEKCGHRGGRLAEIRALYESTEIDAKTPEGGPIYRWRTFDRTYIGSLLAEVDRLKAALADAQKQLRVMEGEPCPECEGRGILCCCGVPLNGRHDHNSCGPPIPCDRCGETGKLPPGYPVPREVT